MNRSVLFSENDNVVRYDSFSLTLSNSHSKSGFDAVGHEYNIY